jgi:UDP-glucose 4-epimerase
VRYLVFGGAGYLGSHLVDNLLASNNEVVVFDDKSGRVKSSFDSRVKFIYGDISKIDDFSKLQTHGVFDGVFNLAAKKSISESFKFPDRYLDVNEKGFQNILTYCQTNHVEKIVFTSSAAVYGDNSTVPIISENVTPKPNNLYGSTKLNSEKYLEVHSSDYDFKSISLRIFNIIGASKREYLDFGGENIFPIVMDKLKHNRTLNIFGKNFSTSDGTCVRDYVNVKDVAKAHILAMGYLSSDPKARGHDSINICSSKGTSILDLVSKVSKISGKTLRYQFEDPRVGDVASVIGNNTLAREKFGWEPTLGIDESIEETLRFI